MRVPQLVLVHGAQLALGPGGGGLTQEEMWTLVGSRGHVLESVRRLRADGYLDPGAPLSLGPELGGVIGVHVSSETLRAGWFDANGRLRARHTADAVPDRLRSERREKTLAGVRSAVNEVLREAMRVADAEDAKPDGTRGRRPLYVERKVDGITRRRLPLLGVAVAWPFPVNRYTKQPEGLAIPDTWAKKRLIDVVADELGLPAQYVHALNAANAGALAEAFRSVRSINAEKDRKQRSQLSLPQYPPAHTAMTIRVGGGIGAGTMVVQAYDPRSFRSFIDAVLLEAEDGLAGEIGHLVVDESSLALVNQDRGNLPELRSDWKCSCGRLGHLEAIAGGRGLVNRALAVEDPQLREELGIPPESEARNRNRDLLSEVTRAIDDDDDSHPALGRALRDAGRVIGHALAGTVLMLAPSSVAFIGPAACEPLTQGFITGVHDRGGFHGKHVNVKALRGDDNAFGPARGAALSLFRREIYRNFGRFERLQAKSGEKQLANDDRLFDSSMHLVSPKAILRGKR